MDEGGEDRMLQAQALVSQHDQRYEKHPDRWKGGRDDDDDDDDMSNVSSSFDNSSSSNDGSTSSSLSDDVDDASSPISTSSSSSNSTGPLFELSDLKAHLPIKRGLSNFYQGKSQSFTFLSRVTTIEDLPKKEATPYRRKLKASKSYGNGFDSYKPYTLPKGIISKKISRGGASLSFPVRGGSFFNSSSSRPPLAPPNK